MKIEIDEEFDRKVARFGEILKKFNEIHSLSNYTNLKEIVKDSLEGLEFIEKEPKVAIDIGSGAGFPAIFLAFVFKDTKWHLFEPNFKKSAFLTFVKLDLKLENITIHKKKLEDDEKFIADLITSRAVMSTKKLLEISSGFYDESSEFLLYKGSSVESEIGELKAKIFNKGNRNYLLIKGKDVR